MKYKSSTGKNEKIKGKNHLPCSFLSFILFVLFVFFSGCKKEKTETIVEITTTEGSFAVKLYNETPQHRDNFLKLAKTGFYDNVLFHRVIADYLIQSGDPDSKNASPNRRLGSGSPGYTIPAEINYPAFFHKKGALCAARADNNNNPQKRSSGSQFYIAVGTIFTNAELDSIESDILKEQSNVFMQRAISANHSKIDRLITLNDEAGLNALQDSIAAQAAVEVRKAGIFRFTSEQREAYTSIGGIPYIDKEYTVFGEVIKGLDIIEKIASAETDRNNRPRHPIRIISAKQLQ